MANFLSTSISALTNARLAIDITGHNIANVNTEGYSRQRVELTARQPQETGVGFIGTGVRATGITRTYDQFLGKNIIEGTSLESRLATMANFASRIDNLLADPDIGISPSLQKFFSALQDATNDPTSPQIRQVLLGEADALSSRFRVVDREIRAIESEVNQNVASSVQDVNQIATAIADLNGQIMSAEQSIQRAPNDLLDRRDVLINRLAEQLDISTVRTSEGSINVIFEPGHSLVTGTTANQLVVARDDLSIDRFTVQLRALDSNATVDVQITGGNLGGLLEARADLIDPALRDLGRTATALAITFNEQSRSGADLNGNLGIDFWALSPPSVSGSTNNAGNGAISASIDNLAALTGDEYTVTFNGAGYDVTRLADGTSVVATGTGTVGDPLLFDGVSVVASGTPVSGDRFAVRPTRDAANTIDVAITDATRIALALPVRTAADLANLGDAAVSGERVVDVNDPNLLVGAVIEFTAANTYTIDGAGAFAYTSGGVISVNGSEFTITGAPEIGDTFRLEANANGTGDNRNGALLVDLQSLQTLEGGTMSLIQSYGELITDVGTTTSKLTSGLEAQSILLDNAIQAQQDNSGVNLDEEAANLIKFQQSYQAAAQLVNTANTLFDELISVFRR